MGDNAQYRVQNTIKGLVESLDRQFLRKMELRMHQCATDCCKNEDNSMEKVHFCVERCQGETQRAQKYVQTELQRFNDGLSRCIMQCQDNVKDKVSLNATEAEVTKLRGVFEDCAIKCCDNNIAKVSDMKKRLSDNLTMGRF